MSYAVFFGEWVAQRRKTLDMTQRDLAAQTNCSLATIKKIETGERRPSRELAEAFTGVLCVPAHQQALFVDCARGLRSVDALRGISETPFDAPAPVPLAAVTLPANVTPLIGRTAELTQIADLLDKPECRLLTLIGTGGVGKTRLAIEAARAQRDPFIDGVIFIPLTAVTDADLIPTALAQSLRLGLSGSAEVQLITYLRDKTMLLVLDNCEQLVDGMDWLSELLRHAPHIKLLATSRERLQLAEEWIYPVPMLDEAQAVDLFEQTALRLSPHFPAAEKRPSVRMICQLVENLPLATELAASWTPFLSCEEIVQNIQQNIDFLSANVRNMPERHRSMRAVFDHSWRLLTPTEQEVMMRLSVFRGGWTISEGQSIAGATVFLLRALAEKSLVRTNADGRYDLHELIRQYAADQLREAGQDTETRQKHATVYLALAGALDAQLHTATGIAAFARLDQEQNNMRAALHWAMDRGNLNLARQYVDKLSLYWWRRGHWAEGEHWTTTVDARPGEGDSTLLCWALMDASFFLSLQGRYTEAFPYMARAEAMAARLEDPETTMRVLIVQVQTRAEIEAVSDAFDTFFATAEHVKEHSKSGLDAMLAGGYAIYGDRLRDAGLSAQAEIQYRRSLDLWRQMGNADGIAYPIGNLGRLALQAGRLQEAYDLLSESVTISRAIGNRLGIADWLPHLGNALLSLGDIAQAEACYDEALSLCEEIGNQVNSADILIYLGYTSLVKGETHSAWDYLHRGLTIYHAFSETQKHLGDNWAVLLPPEFVMGLKASALLEIAEGSPERALVLLSAAASLEAKLGRSADLGLQARVDEALQRLQSMLPQETFAQARSTGESMLPETIMVYALEGVE